MQHTPQDLREMVDAGDAVARYIKVEESWYCREGDLNRGVRKSWSLGLDGPEGTFGEWMLDWVDLGQELAPQWRVFDDGLRAFLAIEGLPEAIEVGGPSAVERRLLDLGFVDRTQRESPYALAEQMPDLTKIPEAIRERLLADLLADRSRKGV